MMIMMMMIIIIIMIIMIIINNDNTTTTTTTNTNSSFYLTCQSFMKAVAMRTLIRCIVIDVSLTCLPLYTSNIIQSSTPLPSLKNNNIGILDYM